MQELPKPFSFRPKREISVSLPEQKLKWNIFIYYFMRFIEISQCNRIWLCQRADKAMNSKRLRRWKHRSNVCNPSRRNKKSIVKWKIAPRQPETRRIDIQDTKIWPCDPRLRNSFLFGRGRTAQSTDFILSLSWYQRAECWQKWPVDSHKSVGWVTD